MEKECCSVGGNVICTPTTIPGFFFLQPYVCLLFCDWVFAVLEPVKLALNAVNNRDSKNEA